MFASGYVVRVLRRWKHVLRLGIPKGLGEKISVDVAIIGAGPAGLAAALYIARYKLSCVVVGEVPGGQLSLAGIVENYLGFKRIHGRELALKFIEHVRSYGVEILNDRVTEVKRSNGVFNVRTRNGRNITAKTIIVAIGCKRRRLGVPGESLRGVSYCATCDAPLYRGAETVAVIGGGDAAVEGALMLSEYVSKVYLVHRRSELRAQPILRDALREKSNIELVLNHIVERIEGERWVERLVLRNKVTGETKVLRVNGVFIEIGFEPDREFHEKLRVKLDEEGYIIVNEYMETSVKGLFAAGECTNMWKEFRQITTAAAQGSVAAYSAYRYLSSQVSSQPA